jgi:hypothetical protein
LCGAALWLCLRRRTAAATAVAAAAPASKPLLGAACSPGNRRACDPGSESSSHASISAACGIVAKRCPVPHFCIRPTRPSYVSVARAGGRLPNPPVAGTPCGRHRLPLDPYTYRPPPRRRSICWCPFRSPYVCCYPDRKRGTPARGPVKPPCGAGWPRTGAPARSSNARRATVAPCLLCRQPGRELTRGAGALGVLLAASGPGSTHPRSRTIQARPRDPPRAVCLLGDARKGLIELIVTPCPPPHLSFPLCS